MKTKLRPGLALRPLRVLFPVCALFGCLAQGSLALETQVQVLARVEVTAPITALDLPIHAWLQDALGQEYLLVICAESRLAKSTWPYRILDSDALAEEYVLANTRRAGAGAAAAERYSVVHDDGLRLVMRVTPGRAEELAGMGYAIQRLSQEPIVWRRAQPAGEGMPEQRKDLEGFSPNPLLGQMVSRVQPSDLLARLRRVSGEELVVAGGDPYAITTRHTGSGLPVQKATQFAYEQLQALGLDTRYHNWSRSGYTNRNVISTQPGTARSNEVVLITAHLDDMPGGERAPGADDNASGSVAVLTAADLFAQLGFERTVRFVLFTGEEQGLLGSAQYAAEAAAAGDNIVAVFNMDMLAWDHSGGPALRLHTRTTGNPGYSNDLFIASVFTNVVSAYGLSNSLSPIITPNADGASDHASFWNKGYPALYAEEDYPDDFNPYYHSVNDTLANVNLDYFTAFTRAALGTVAHLAAPTGAVSFEAIEVANSDWTPGSGIGAGVFYARHVADATE
ncbi:MAG: M28 family metallopeptidase, partial [Verrucomicrobiota bacterium]